uniref:Uncharacterized protein n=1 Tax=Anopheles merus TaxID=30066 RepID=A0A182V623_ANOME
MSMSPGVMRRPGGMGGRDMHPQNHAPSYQPQQNLITTDKSQKAPVFYKSGTEPRLSGFTPFDLERWWGQRMVHHINIGSHGHQ